MGLQNEQNACEDSVKLVLKRNPPPDHEGETTEASQLADLEDLLTAPS